MGLSFEAHISLMGSWTLSRRSPPIAREPIAPSSSSPRTMKDFLFGLMAIFTSSSSGFILLKVEKSRCSPNMAAHQVVPALPIDLGLHPFANLERMFGGQGAGTSSFSLTSTTSRSPIQPTSMSWPPPPGKNAVRSRATQSPSTFSTVASKRAK